MRHEHNEYEHGYAWNAFPQKEKLDLRLHQHLHNPLTRELGLIAASSLVGADRISSLLPLSYTTLDFPGEVYNLALASEVGERKVIRLSKMKAPATIRAKAGIEKPFPLGTKCWIFGFAGCNGCLLELFDSAAVIWNKPSTLVNK